MSKFIGMALAMLLGISLLGFSSPATARPVAERAPGHSADGPIYRPDHAIRCYNRARTDHGTYRAGYALPLRLKKVYVRGTVNYQHCVNPDGPDWSRVKSILSFTDIQGRKRTCGRFTDNWSNKKIYFHPRGISGNGRTFRMRGWHHKCTKSTTATRLVRYSNKNAPRIFSRGGNQPKFEIQVEQPFEGPWNRSGSLTLNYTLSRTALQN